MSMIRIAHGGPDGITRRRVIPPHRVESAADSRGCETTLL